MTKSRISSANIRASIKQTLMISGKVSIKFCSLKFKNILIKLWMSSKNSSKKRIFVKKSKVEEKNNQLLRSNNISSTGSSMFKSDQMTLINADQSSSAKQLFRKQSMATSKEIQLSLQLMRQNLYSIQSGIRQRMK